MNHISRIIASLAASLVLCSLAPSATAEDLLDVYEAAKDNDALLRASRAGYAASEQAVPQARSALLPTLGASASTTWTEREFPGSLITDPTSPLFGQEVPDQNFNDHGWNAQLRAMPPAKAIEKAKAALDGCLEKAGIYQS